MNGMKMRAQISGESLLLRFKPNWKALTIIRIYIRMCIRTFAEPFATASRIPFIWP
jgi:hypothetical protein